jgi:hypothetical protein
LNSHAHKSGIFSAVLLSFSYVKRFASAEKIAKIKEMAAAANTKTATIVSPGSIKALQNLINDEESYQLEWAASFNFLSSLTH